MKKGKF